MPPLAVRVQVAERQYMHRFPTSMQWIVGGRNNGSSNTSKLKFLLAGLFKGEPCALDHDPALIRRPYNPRIKDVAARYTPHAHDPAALIYREKANHGEKTTGRKPGAARTVTIKGSDIGYKTKFNRLERKKKEAETKAFFKARKPGTLQGWANIINRPKAKIPGRPFPKGRKFNDR